MNPIDTINRTVGVIRLIVAALLLGIFGWGLLTGLTGNKIMADLDEEAAEISSQYREAQRQELRDTMLADGGWGEGAQVVTNDKPDSRDLRAEATDMIEDEEGGWGISTR